MGDHDDQKENHLQFLGENDRARFLKSEVMLICCFQKKKKKRKKKRKDLLEGSNGQKKKKAFCQAGKNLPSGMCLHEQENPSTVLDSFIDICRIRD